MSDKIIIGADLDLSTVEKKLSELQNKIKSFTNMNPGAGGMAGLGGGNQQLADRLKQTQLGMHKRLQSEITNELIKQNKAYMDVSKTIDGQVGKQQLMIKGTREAAALQESITKNREKEWQHAVNINRLRSQAQAMQSGVPGGPGNALGNMYLKNAGLPKGGSPFNLAAGMAGLAFGTSRAIRTAGELNLAVKTQRARESGAESSVAGVLSESAGLQARGRGYEMSLYNPQRLEAMNMARSRMQAEKVNDASKIASVKNMGIMSFATMVAGGISLAMKKPLMAAGFMGVSTLLGGSGINDAINLGKDDRTRTAMLGNKEAYKNFLGATGAEEYKKAVETEKSKTPLLVEAQEFFEKKRGSMLGMQRALGLSDKELFGGNESLYQRAGKAKFTDEIINRQAKGILSAGGTTAAAKGGAVMSAQLERGLDLTNASSLMGRISGRTGGSAAESKDEVIRLYAEATRIGLNTSEVRNLLDTSTKIALQTGASSGSVQQALMSGLTVKSPRGMQAAANALERMRGKTKQMGGLRSQFALAEFGDMESLGKDQQFSFKESGTLAGISVDEMTPENKIILGMLQKRKLTPQQQKRVLKELKQKSIRTTLKTNTREKALANLEQIAKTDGENSPEYNIAYSEAAQEGYIEEGQAFANLANPEKEAETRMTARGLDTGGRATQEQIDAARIKADKESGRSGDSAIASESADFLRNLSNLNKHINTLVSSFDVNSKTDAVTNLWIEMNRLVSKGVLSMEGLNSYFEKMEELNNLSAGGKMSYPPGYTPGISGGEINFGASDNEEDEEN